MQSWGWGEVQREFGLPVWRLRVSEDERIIGAALVVRRSLPGGLSWLYVPRGPTFAPQGGATAFDSESPLGRELGVERQARGVGKPSGWDEVQERLLALAQQEKAIFVRVEPAMAAPGVRSVSGFTWRKADHDVQPRHTLVVDLTRPEEAWRAGLHPKTRYNIGLSQRRGVRVRFSCAEGDLEAFLRLSREVAARGPFRFHPDAYYRALHRVGCQAGSGLRVEMAVAERDGRVLAVHWLVSFGSTVTYVHGASSSRDRQHMAPHLLQWESLRRAQALGFTRYDLFGVAPPSAPHSGATGGKPPGASMHPWAGITRFKEGFGGQRVTYPGAYDYVINPLTYWLYTAARRLVR